MPLRLLNSPTLQIILAIVCGVLLGVLDPLLAIDMKPLSDGFIRVIGWFMPWMMFLLVLALTAFAFWTSRRWVHYERK